jgi:predicted phage terminase large subunit-like protein
MFSMSLQPQTAPSCSSSNQIFRRDAHFNGLSGFQAYCRDYLADNLPRFARECLPELCRLPFSRLHASLFRRRRAKTIRPLAERTGQLDVILAPRGAAKSSLMSLVFPLHALLFDSERYIILISATLHQATQRLANLRGLLTSSPLVRELFPERLARLRRGSSRVLELGEIRVEAFSAGSELRGITHGPWRPTWVILDDIERGDRVASATQRDALGDWFHQVVEPLGDRTTHIDLVGTLLHRDALPARLLQRPDVQGHIFRSILTESDRPDLWAEWRARYADLSDADRLATARRFFETERPAMAARARVLWPAREDYYDLQQLRTRLGNAAFEQEKQNAPALGVGALFIPSQLHWFTLREKHLELDLPPAVSAITSTAPPRRELADLQIYGFLDPALGGKDGDYAAIATLGTDAAGYFYLLDLWIERAGPARQIAVAFDLHARWHYNAFAVETVAFQKLLLEHFETERTRRRAQSNAGAWDLPLYPFTPRGEKLARIAALEPLTRNGWLLFNHALPETFTRQLSDFPRAQHDDGPDALAGAIHLAQSRLITHAACLTITRRPPTTPF